MSHGNDPDESPECIHLQEENLVPPHVSVSINPPQHPPPPAEAPLQDDLKSNASDDNMTTTQIVERDLQNQMSANVDGIVRIEGDELSKRRKTVMLTWSHSDKPNVLSPTDARVKNVGSVTDAKSITAANTVVCKWYALKVSQSWDEVCKDQPNAPKIIALHVRPEYHATNGMLHLHCVLDLDKKSRKFPDLLKQLRKDKIYAHLQSATSTRPFDILFKYISTPTPQKPHILEGYSMGKVDSKLVDAATKAMVKYMNAPANDLQVNKFINEYYKIIPTPSDFMDLMTGENAPPSETRGKEDPSLLFEFLRVKKWWIKNSSRNGQSFVRGCYDMIQRKETLEYRNWTPKNHLNALSSIGECEDTSCTFLQAWNTLEETSDLAPYRSYLKKFYTDALPWGGSRIGGRPRNVCLWGKPSAGKSTLENLLTFSIPENRIFTMRSGNFPMDGASDLPALLLVTSSDFRMSQKLEVEPMLLATEGKDFNIDLKGKPPTTVKGPITFVLSSNRFDSGWDHEDIQALHARFVIVRLSPIPEEKRLKNLNFCKKCAYRLCNDIITDRYVPPSCRSEERPSKRQRMITELQSIKSLKEEGMLSPRTFEKMCKELTEEYHRS